MATPNKECIECGYEANEECDVCGHIVCDDCIDLHGEFVHSDDNDVK